MLNTTNNPNGFSERKAKVLIVDDELPIREVLSASLRDEGHEVMTASDGDQGLKLMKEFQPEIVFLDIWMPGSLDGIEVLTEARKKFPQTEFIMISGHGTIETAVKATKLGAWDFIEKPLSMDKISIGITNIINYQNEKDEKVTLLNKLRRSIALVGDSAQMISLKQMIARVAATQSWVLLQGENGAGKELTAQNIHYLSNRAGRAFVDLTCASIPEDLIDTELFGYEKGAFAGAMKTQKGKIELANGGTLFIDDVCDLSMKAQEKLLKVLQEKKFHRVGGSESVSVDVRVICATDRNIEEEIKAGRFREDLYHRINLMPFKIPALQDHIDDIPALITHFSDLAVKEGGFLRKQFSDQALTLMKQYRWPGNVRELKNFIERIYILTPNDVVDVLDIQFAGLNGKANAEPGAEDNSFREARAKFEKEYLERKIAENGGNISKTAEVIGLERSYLHRKIKAFGIETQKGSEEQL